MSWKVMLPALWMPFATPKRAPPGPSIRVTETLLAMSRLAATLWLSRMVTLYCWPPSAGRHAVFSSVGTPFVQLDVESKTPLTGAAQDVSQVSARATWTLPGASPEASTNATAPIARSRMHCPFSVE
jgi:hypothetical protein